MTFRADRTGELRLGSVDPGELQADGTITTDRIPCRAMAGTPSAVVARWAPGSGPQRALESIAGRDPSGLCAAEAARLADPPAPPAGWDTHPLTGREQAFFPTGAGITSNTDWTSAIIRHWRRRETHIVARTGTADLGRWVDEERPVLADHQSESGAAERKLDTRQRPAASRASNAAAWQVPVGAWP